MFVGVFSTVALADVVDIDKEYAVNIQTYINDQGWTNSPIALTVVYPNDGQIQKYEAVTTVHLDHCVDSTFEYWVYYKDYSVMFEKNKVSRVSLDNVYFSTYYPITGEYSRSIYEIYYLLYYADGTNEYFRDDSITYSQDNANLNIDFEVTPQKDVIGFSVYAMSRYPSYRAQTTNCSQYLGEWNNEGSYQFSLDIQTEEAGLLKTVIEWLKGIKNGITDLFNSILELPSKIWSFIENGLKSLFVPSEDYMTSYKDKWDLLLSSRFGAVYEACDVTVDFVNRILNLKGIDEYIEIPETTINFGEDSFTFGGNRVQVVPSGFEWLRSSIQIFTSIVAVLLFINGLLKRYDKIIGGDGE